MRRPVAWLLFAAALLGPQVAQANDMGGLAYVVLVWPIALVLILAAIVLGVIGGRFLSAPPHAHHVYGVVLVVLGLLFGAGFPLASLWIDRHFQSRGPWLISAVPVILAGLVLVYLGWRLW